MRTWAVRIESNDVVIKADIESWDGQARPRVSIAAWDPSGRPVTVTGEMFARIRETLEYQAALAAAEAMAAEANAERERELAEEANFRAEQARLRAQAEREGTPVFIRFGRPPRSGRSRNWRDGSLEDGVSCYAGWKMSDGSVILDWRGIDVGSALCIARSPRPAYVLTGPVVGYGSDGEPVIAVTSAKRLGDDVVIRAVTA